MEVDPRKLPIWTGARGHSRQTWISWRLALAGYVGGKGLYPLLQPGYVNRPTPTLTSTEEERRTYDTHTRNTRSLWFIFHIGTSYTRISCSHRRTI